MKRERAPSPQLVLPWSLDAEPHELARLVVATEETFPPAHDAWHWTPGTESGPKCGGPWSGLGGLVPELERVRVGLGVNACPTCLELEALAWPVEVSPCATVG